MCSNTIGSYECFCTVGYIGNGFTCSKRAELFGSTVAKILKLLFSGCTNGEVLLYNGATISTNHSNGTVLVCVGNEYGTVCDDWWDTLDATVVCTQLGFSVTGVLAFTTCLKYCNFVVAGSIHACHHA